MGIGSEGEIREAHQLPVCLPETEPNALVGTYHPKAMPFILTTQEEIDLCMAETLAKHLPCNGRCRTTH
jgi:hypothetical protein